MGGGGREISRVSRHHEPLDDRPGAELNNPFGVGVHADEPFTGHSRAIYGAGVQFDTVETRTLVDHSSPSFPRMLLYTCGSDGIRQLGSMDWVSSSTGCLRRSGTYLTARQPYSLRKLKEQIRRASIIGNGLLFQLV